MNVWTEGCDVPRVVTDRKEQGRFVGVMRGRVRVGGRPREEREKEGEDRFRVFVL
jgi:hypothetical protein